MKFLKNKKGIDYAFLLAFVVFVCIIYLFVVLNGKLNEMHWKIGEHEVALLNAYQKGEEQLLYVDNSARISAWQAVDSLAEVGGMPDQDCGTVNRSIGTTVVQYTYWKSQNQDCLDKSNVYEEYSDVLNEKLNNYLKLRKMPQNNYEFTVLPEKVSGFAFRPLEIPVKAPPEKIVYYFLIFKVYEDEFEKVLAIGKYYVHPSFTAHVKTRLQDYGVIKAEVIKLLDCAKHNIIIDTCIGDIEQGDLDWKIEKSLGTDIYYFDIAQSIENPYTGKNPVVRFALNIPRPVPLPTPATSAPAIPLPTELPTTPVLPALPI